MRLALFHPDVATIRRGMVDAGLVTREAGEYRRGHRLTPRLGVPSCDLPRPFVYSPPTTGSMRP